MKTEGLSATRWLDGPSVRDALLIHKGAGPGFDFWRFFLSSAVIFLHSFHVAYGTGPGGAKVSFLGPLFCMILPIFFGLSGFLVAGSAIRTADVKVFLSFRAIRLVPALTVEVGLSALILGPLLTAVPLRTYFTSHEFFAYWGNIVGRVRYALPGMFLHNPIPDTINENLWTLHAELECYGILAAAMLLGLLHRRNLLLALWSIATLCMFFLSVEKGWFIRTALYPASAFVYAFCTGVVAFFWRDRIKLSYCGMVLSLVAYAALFYLKFSGVLAVIPLIYVMIWVGMNDRLQFSVLKKGDYSYGLYLYGFAIQQTLALLLPGLRTWWFIFPVSLILTLGFAVLSWHFIEKPALLLKKLISPRKAALASASHPHTQRAQELLRLEEAVLES